MVETLCRPAALAVELVRGGARLTVVGSTAHWLRHGRGAPHDLDIAVDDTGVPALVAALTGLGASVGEASLLRCRDLRVSTGWGPLDVFVGRRPRSVLVAVDGVEIPVLEERSA